MSRHSNSERRDSSRRRRKERSRSTPAGVSAEDPTQGEVGIVC